MSFLIVILLNFSGHHYRLFGNSYKHLNIIVVLLCFGEDQCKLAWLTNSGGVVDHICQFWERRVLSD